MRGFLRPGYWAFVFVFIFSVFAISSYPQKSASGLIPVLWEDTSLQPHDFTNEYYTSIGVNPKAILGRRTGEDTFSVFSGSSNPNHTNVRVIVTLPAYTESGQIVFWYPLGELNESGFTLDTKEGSMALEAARLSPIYIFPDVKYAEFYSFGYTRQAPVIIDPMPMFGQDRENNKLGIRQMVVVNYTEKARDKEGLEMMEYFGKKNGFATDDTPIIKSMEDLQYLLKMEFITADPLNMTDGKGLTGSFAISPTISDPTNGVIATDAYIWMSMKDGKPLAAEEMFSWHFGCLQKVGQWCQ
jgi:hypothetical protein